MTEKLIRDALDHVVADQHQHLPSLEEALGERIDDRGFALGFAAATFVMQGTNVIELAKHYPVLFEEFLQKVQR